MNVGSFYLKPTLAIKNSRVIHRSVLLERLVDFEIELGSKFTTQMLPAGYSLNKDWLSLPRSAHESKNGIILISAEIPLLGIRPRLALLPPFPIQNLSEADSFDGLKKFAMSSYAIGIILLRLGHWAIAIAEDGELVVTKTGSRYVKGQHRKGGQSSNRFRRNREKWIRELFDEAAKIAKSRFSDYPGELDFLALGGDRLILGQFMKRITLPNGLAGRVLPNRLSVIRPGRQALEDAVREAWSFRAFDFVGESVRD